MELSPERHGTFDVVLFLGVLYHLRDPFEALARVSRLTRELLVVETHVDMLWSRGPAAAFYPGDELNRDASNWWGFNERALHAMLQGTGFDRIEVVHRRSFARRLARAVKLRIGAAQTPFVPSLRQGRIALHALKSPLSSSDGGSLPPAPREEAP